MTTETKLSLLAAILLSSGCNTPTITTTESTTIARGSVSTPITGNLAHDKLSGLDFATQATFLGKVVRSSGDSCYGADVFFQGMYKNDNSAFWSVRCTNGKSYQVSISADARGSTKVLDCTLLKAVANVSCFQKLDEQ